MLLFCGGPRRDGDDHRHKEDKLYGDHHEWKGGGLENKRKMPEQMLRFAIQGSPSLVSVCMAGRSIHWLVCLLSFPSLVLPLLSCLDVWLCSHLIHRHFRLISCSFHGGTTVAFLFRGFPKWHPISHGEKKVKFWAFLGWFPVCMNCVVGEWAGGPEEKESKHVVMTDRRSSSFLAWRVLLCTSSRNWCVYYVCVCVWERERENEVQCEQRWIWGNS